MKQLSLPMPPEILLGLYESVWQKILRQMKSVPSLFHRRRAILEISALPKYEDCSDEELMVYIRNGDNFAFEYLYRTYAKMVFGFARKNLSSREECEEIVQDIFVSLWQRRRGIFITTIQGYLFNAARYRVIHHFRAKRLKRKYEQHFKLFEAVYDTLPENARNADTIYEILYKGIDSLPQRCQEAIRLRLAEDISNGEIATRMSISVRTVEAYMFQAFNHLRNFCTHEYKYL